MMPAMFRFEFRFFNLVCQWKYLHMLYIWMPLFGTSTLHCGNVNWQLTLLCEYLFIYLLFRVFLFICVIMFLWGTFLIHTHFSCLLFLFFCYSVKGKWPFFAMILQFFCGWGRWRVSCICGFFFLHIESNRPMVWRLSSIFEVTKMTTRHWDGYNVLKTLTSRWWLEWFLGYFKKSRVTGHSFATDIRGTTNKKRVWYLSVLFIV